MVRSAAAASAASTGSAPRARSTEAACRSSERRTEGAACHGCLYIAECSCERFNRFLDRVTETAGLYNLAGFVDDARALTALPARHDLWRRRTCGWLARKVEAGFLREEEAHRFAWELAYGLVLRAYRLR